MERTLSCPQCGTPVANPAASRPANASAPELLSASASQPSNPGLRAALIDLPVPKRAVSQAMLSAPSGPPTGSYAGSGTAGAGGRALLAATTVATAATSRRGAMSRRSSPSQRRRLGSLRPEELHDLPRPTGDMFPAVPLTLDTPPPRRRSSTGIEALPPQPGRRASSSGIEPLAPPKPGRRVSSSGIEPLAPPQPGRRASSSGIEPLAPPQPGRRASSSGIEPLAPPRRRSSSAIEPVAAPQPVPAPRETSRPAPPGSDFLPEKTVPASMPFLLLERREPRPEVVSIRAPGGLPLSSGVPDAPLSGTESSQTEPDALPAPPGPSPLPRLSPLRLTGPALTGERAAGTPERQPGRAHTSPKPGELGTSSEKRAGSLSPLASESGRAASESGGRSMSSGDPGASLRSDGAAAASRPSASGNTADPAPVHLGWVIAALALVALLLALWIFQHATHRSPDGQGYPAEIHTPDNPASR